VFRSSAASSGLTPQFRLTGADLDIELQSPPTVTSENSLVTKFLRRKKFRAR
jgi:hypothetical protein